VFEAMTSTRVGVSDFSTSLIGCSAQELLQRDVRIVRWFIGERWSRCAKTDSTLGQLLAVSEKLDLNGPAKSIESIKPEDARHLLHASAALATC
jgi:hypothetical protein